MVQNNKECLVCHGRYTYCPTCSEYRMLPRWMTAFCSENCRDIFDIFCDFEQGSMTEDEAREKLAALDMSKKANYTMSLKRTLEKLFPASGQSASDSGRVKTVRMKRKSEGQSKE